MPKINKETMKVFRNGISIYKYQNKNTYFCRFYVGRTNNQYSKSGRFEKSTKTKNIRSASPRGFAEAVYQHNKDVVTDKNILAPDPWVEVLSYEV